MEERNKTLLTSTESTAMQLQKKLDEPNKYMAKFLFNSMPAREDKLPSNQVI
jgi:hypothetical protein